MPWGQYDVRSTRILDRTNTGIWNTGSYNACRFLFSAAEHSESEGLLEQNGKILIYSNVIIFELYLYTPKSESWR